MIVHLYVLAVRITGEILFEKRNTDGPLIAGWYGIFL
jgi:hypothetical protein